MLLTWFAGHVSRQESFGRRLQG